MANKTRRDLIINRAEPQQAPASAGVTVASSGTGEPTTPTTTAPSTPVNLVVTGSGLSGVGVQTSAWVSLAWINPGGLVPTQHYIVWDDDPLFGSAKIETSGSAQSATIYGLPTDTQIYFRVSAGRNNQYSASSTPADTTTPTLPAPTGISSLTSSWSGRDGNLAFEWVNPADPLVRDVVIEIYTASGGILLRTIHTTGPSAVWLRAEMLQDRGALVLPAFATCYVEVRTRGWDGQLSSATTATITKAQPNIPLSFNHDWTNDSLIADWLVGSDAAGYALSIDGNERILARDGIYEYTYELNQADHSGVADPTVQLLLYEMDALGQKSSLAATINATKPTPSAPSSPPLAFLSDTGAIRVEVDPTDDSPDIWRIIVRVYVGGVQESVFYIRSGSVKQTLYAPEVDSFGYGDYSFDAARQNKYGQTSTYSSTTTPIAIVNPNGTWTPTAVGGTTAGVTVYGTNGQVGRYTLVGNAVIFQLRVSWTAATGTGEIRISLPFTSLNVTNASTAVAVLNTNVTFVNGTPQAQIMPNTNYITMRSPITNAASSNVNIDADGGTVVVGGVYMRA